MKAAALDVGHLLLAKAYKEGQLSAAVSMAATLQVSVNMQVRCQHTSPGRAPLQLSQANAWVLCRALTAEQRNILPSARKGNYFVSG